jgi:putative flavoprotein involved in K+ transport
VPEEVVAPSPSLVLTGANGGERLDLGLLDEIGVVIAGRLLRFDGSRALFADDLGANVAEADTRMRRALSRIDDHVARLLGRRAAPDEDAVPSFSLASGPTSLDLRAAGITTVIWATGFRRAYPWLRVPVLDGARELVHRRGHTPAPGLFGIGLRFQRKRKSHFIGGVGEDAVRLAGTLLGRAAIPLELAA